jgi:hypothetical protein
MELAYEKQHGSTGRFSLRMSELRCALGTPTLRERCGPLLRYYPRGAVMAATKETVRARLSALAVSQISSVFCSAKRCQSAIELSGNARMYFDRGSNATVEPSAVPLREVADGRPIGPDAS